MKYVYKVFQSRLWLRIFYHNVTFRDEFSSESEALSSNTATKFSILSEIDGNFKFEGKFEFLLEYPGHEGHQRWKQTNFPLSELESADKANASGYEEVSISWRTNY
jgi:hypothetical protein